MLKYPVVRRCIAAAMLGALTGGAANALESYNGIQLIDRGASGEIVIGFPSGGVAVIDYDDDGWMDLLVGRTSAPLIRLYQSVPDPNAPGHRSFDDVTTNSGIWDSDATGRTPNGVLVGDYDNDGRDDVFVCGATTTSHGLLYRNNGNGTFTNVSVASGVRGDGPADAAAWVDFDLDGDLDLMLSLEAAPWFRLLINNGDGTFADGAALLPVANLTSRPYGHAFSDFDGDGYPDFYGLSRNGAGTEMLWHNIDDGVGGRQFVNIAQQVGYVSHGPAPMGIAFGDFDGDGDLDIGISDAVVGTFYRHDGDHYTKVQPFDTMFGWGVEWVDVDNDGNLDFFTAGSYGTSAFDNLQLNNGDGTFTNISTVLNGVSAPSRYSLQLDFNNDGRQDIISLGIGQLVSIYENTSEGTNHWAQVRLIGDGCRVARSAANAKIRLVAGGQTQIREVVNGSSTTATEDPRQHFGLGTATIIDSIEVEWPRTGSLAERTELFEGPFAADQLITLMSQTRPTDLNLDGNVDLDDLSIMLVHFGSTGAAPEDGDVDGDGDVDLDDLSLLLVDFGSSCS